MSRDTNIFVNVAQVQCWLNPLKVDQLTTYGCRLFDSDNLYTELPHKYTDINFTGLDTRIESVPDPYHNPWLRSWYSDDGVFTCESIKVPGRAWLNCKMPKRR